MVTYNLFQWDQSKEGSIFEFLDLVDLKKLGKYWIFEDDGDNFLVHKFNTEEEMLKGLKDLEGSQDFRVIEKGTHAIFIQTW